MEDVDGKYRLLNLDQLRMVDQIEDGHCRLIFGDNFTVELTGKGADHLISRLLAESEVLDGTLLVDHIDKVRSTKPGKVLPIKAEDETGHNE